MPATYMTLVTTIGQAKIANAIALGQTVALTHMAVGDGAGNPTTPSESQTSLVREVYRGSINRLEIDSNNANMFLAELAVPTNVGGWTAREVGVFDGDGNLFAIANFPETYKPLVSEGSGRDLVIRIIMEVANASVVTLVVDPNVVVASRAWVIDNFSMENLAPGGLTNQVLAKKSNQDGDVEWRDPAGFSFVVPALVEQQTLADLQTIVNLNTVGTQGMGLYIEGAREFDFTINTASRFTLGRSYPPGTRIWVVQNDPMSEVDSESIGYGSSNVKEFLDSMFSGPRSRLYTGYSSANTGTNDLNKWFKVGQCDNTASTDFGAGFVLDWTITKGSYSAQNPSMNAGRIYGLVKKQGTTWNMALLIDQKYTPFLATDNFVLVQPVSDNRLELWAKIPLANSVLQVMPTVRDSSWQWFDNGAFSAVLPSNYKTVYGISPAGLFSVLKATEAEIVGNLAGNTGTFTGALSSVGISGGIEYIDAPTAFPGQLPVTKETVFLRNTSASASLTADIYGITRGAVDGQQLVLRRIRSNDDTKSVVLTLELASDSQQAPYAPIFNPDDMAPTPGAYLTGAGFILRYDQTNTRWIIVGTLT